MFIDSYEKFVYRTINSIIVVVDSSSISRIHYKDIVKLQMRWNNTLFNINEISKIIPAESKQLNTIEKFQLVLMRFFVPECTY